MRCSSCWRRPASSIRYAFPVQEDHRIFRREVEVLARVLEKRTNVVFAVIGKGGGLRAHSERAEDQQETGEEASGVHDTPPAGATRITAARHSLAAAMAAAKPS
jgi:hypothetical protein